MAEECILKAVKINKIFPGVKALSNIDFELKKGEVHALLGENGAGKSTLIKIIGGLFTPEEGDIFLDGQKVKFSSPRDAIDNGISVIYQELQLSQNLSLAENIYFGRLPHNSVGVVDKKRLYWDSKAMLHKVGLTVNPNMKVKYLSTAQQQLLEIAKALSTDAKIIIMDEPTSALSLKEIDILFSIINELKGRGVSIIYVSHKLEELFSICDTVTVMRDGEKIQTVKIMDTNQDELVNYMVGRKIVHDFLRNPVNTDETILEIKGLSTTKLKDISLDIKKGEVVGFCGLMGAGKTELAKAIFGLDPIKQGEIFYLGHKFNNSSENCALNGIGYIPEDRKLAGLFLNLSVRENISVSTIKQLSKKGVINKLKENTNILNQITQLSIKTPSLSQKMCNLSGGNQQKCIIARWLFHSQLKLLIIDEPTRGIDVGSKQEIYNILNDLSTKGVSILIMSSEMPELIKMSDRIVVLKEGIVTAVLGKQEINQEALMKYAVV